MDKIPARVKALLETASEKDLYFFGRKPSIKEISNGIANLKIYEDKKILRGRRINMARVCEKDGIIVGYNSFTLLTDAKPTDYERNFMDMGDGLNYVHIKKMFVHPDYRSQGIGTEFVRRNLDLTEKLKKHAIVDVEKDNYRMINILVEQNFQEDYTWINQRKIEMKRYFFLNPKAAWTK